jgi:hypothetical protein
MLLVLLHNEPIRAEAEYRSVQIKLFTRPINNYPIDAIQREVLVSYPNLMTTFFFSNLKMRKGLEQLGNIFQPPKIARRVYLVSSSASVTAAEILILPSPPTFPTIDSHTQLPNTTHLSVPHLSLIFCNSGRDSHAPLRPRSPPLIRTTSCAPPESDWFAS